MNKYVKEFLHIGLIFGGFGPVVVGIVYAILWATLPDITITGAQMCVAIISSYLLAFVHAGASVFNRIETWSVPKSLFWHLLTLYIAYVTCYLVNTWIPFNALVILIFTGIFVVTYFVVWLTVFLCVKSAQKKMNARLKS